MSTALRPPPPSRSTPRAPIHLPSPDEQAEPARPRRRRPVVSDDLLTVGLALVVLAALVPLRSVFIGSDWIRPVAGGVLLAVGIGWVARRLGVGPLTHLAMTVASLLVFLTVAFVPTTALGGVVPTAETLGTLRDLFTRGLELVEERPSPTFAEPGLLLLAVAGTWTVAYLADGMLFILRSPLKAIACAVVLWSVPLAIAPASTSITAPVVAILAAGGLLLLLCNANTAAGFGVAVRSPGADGRPRQSSPLSLAGLVLAGATILLGLALAPTVPGFDEEPLFETRGGSGTTITTNPIVDIRSRLVASDTGPVVMVTSPRPVYLRTTALDRYEAGEQWTAGTISGTRVSGRVDEPASDPVEHVEVTVEIDANIESSAVLAPAPFQPVEVTGPKAASLRYDARTATLTVPGDAALVEGDVYTVEAAIPQPAVEALRTVGIPGVGTPHTELPAEVPDDVVLLARQIVNDSGAQTMFDAALAIQDHLRGWTYSTQPEPGLGATAMSRFIDAQEGYCEQYAGTMAVMLRTLGIPSRLAVGYTPGDLQADGRWQVTNANAHAWVEVDFGELGWIPFEPTPRSDGNVLITSAGAVVPSQTQAQAADPGLAGGPSEPADPAGTPTPGAAPLPPEDLDVPDSPVGGTPAASAGGIPAWAVLLGLLAVVGAGAALLVRRSGIADTTAPPPVRIAAARARVERVGRAVGRERHPAETDEEYLTRIADGDAAGRALASPATRAVFAPAVSDKDAEAAEGAARVLVTRLTEGLPWWRRMVVSLVVSVRGALGR